ncbi:putative mannosyltransferase YkcB [Alicyclobacillus hesperidum subsp. aegles]|uniref:glycosyltransferase family 39 protein n=1 Tax=Alicyclobacillus hesperidum TaxID=89784 RepID=UPI00222CF44E|nr:glycosyltransferase family 39 protein [Alicyclobacillus hesperidum]GLG00436.1 putative mannosyltransferase YkcB [Alicyclobacillus hesperidum subsp. aegles]
MQRRWTWKWNHSLLTLILAVSGWLNLYALNKEGYGNEYYAAAIRSMLESWHNFFFNAFDPGGFITIDKPPFDFWLQAASAWIFGFHGWALFLPQALAGVASVFVIYHLVCRVFGKAAGLIAAAVLACTPIAVAVQRTNQVDGLLVLLMLMASWCLQKSIETNRLRWLIAVGCIEGIAFNTKMMEAYLILPAIYLTYALVHHVAWRSKLVNLIAMTVVLGVVSFSWATVVQLTPANERPYVGSTTDNNEFTLIFGYNGVNRLTGDMSVGASPSGLLGHEFVESRGQGFPDMPGFQSTQSNVKSRQGGEFGAPPNGQTANYPYAFRHFEGTSGDGGTIPPGVSNGHFGGGGMFDTGRAGILRLFQLQLGPQIGWLLPVACLSLLPLLRNIRWRKTLTKRQLGTVFWTGWLIPVGAFFSIAGFFHQYYLITLAPAIAALTGAGLVRMWNDLWSNSAWRFYLPGVFLIAFGYECFLVWHYPAIRTVLIALAVLLGFCAVLLALLRRRSRSARMIGAVMGLLALLVIPGYWAATPILYGVNGQMPAAGPANASQSRLGTNLGSSMNDNVSQDSALIKYLEAHYRPSKGSFLVATLSAGDAEPIIIATGLPVMAMGGFSGQDGAMTVSKLETLVEEGKVKYFLLAGMGGGMGGQAKLTAWITAHCKLVPQSAWGGSNALQADASGSRSSAFGFGFHGMGGGTSLYEYDASTKS